MIKSKERRRVSGNKEWDTIDNFIPTADPLKCEVRLNSDNLAETLQFLEPTDNSDLFVISFGSDFRNRSRAWTCQHNNSLSAGLSGVEDAI